MTKYSYTTTWYSCEGIVDFANATIQEGKLALKKIA
jgi:hypothetical protein